MNKNADDTVWQKITEDFLNPVVPFRYKTMLSHNSIAVTVLIDMDPGGGFEGGFEYTSMSAPLPIQFTAFRSGIKNAGEFRFALHDEGVLDRVGKFFGMEDTDIGYKEFDKQLIVKTNDTSRVKTVFKDPQARKVFQGLKDFTLQIMEDGNENLILELMIDRAILDAAELKKVYNAYAAILDQLQ
jgi:hypothetical protein